jgi:hypothetical protein
MYEIFAKATQCCEDKSDAMLRRQKRRNVAKTKATQCCEDKSDAMFRRQKRRNVAKTKAMQCKQSYCDVSSFKNKFFVQVRRYIRSLVQESNCEIKNFDVLEILQLKFSCMEIYIENFNFRWKMYDSAEKCMISLKNVWFAEKMYDSSFLPKLNFFADFGFVDVTTSIA